MSEIRGAAKQTGKNVVDEVAAAGNVATKKVGAEVFNESVKNAVNTTGDAVESAGWAIQRLGE